MITNSPFSQLKDMELPAGLEGRVLARVAASRRRASIARAISFGALEIASAVASAFSFAYAFASLKSSGVFEYLSLLATDGGAALAYPKEFFLSVVEALPALGIAAALCAAMVLAWSTAKIVRMSRSHTLFA